MSLEADIRHQTESFLNTTIGIVEYTGDPEIEAIVAEFIEHVKNGQIDIYPNPRTFTSFTRRKDIGEGVVIFIEGDFSNKVKNTKLNKSVFSVVFDAMYLARGVAESHLGEVKELKERLLTVISSEELNE